jgi:hypothetical protein
MSTNTEADSLPSTGIYNNRVKWLLRILWLLALVGTASFFVEQNNDKGASAEKPTIKTQAPLDPDTRFSSSPESTVRPLLSTSPSTSNRIQPATPNITSQDVAGMDSDVYTYVCHDLKIAPSRMQFRCRDGESFIDNIVWNEWKTTGASGKGILNQSDCSFGCQSPAYSKYPVAVKLSSPISDGKMVYFGRFDYLYVSASGREYPGVWDPTAVHDGRVISGNG